MVTDFTCVCLYYDRGTKHQTYDKKEIISMKKVFVTLLSLTMVMSLLAGCGSNEAATDDTASEDNQDAQTELSGSVSTNGSTSMGERDRRSGRAVHDGQPGRDRHL